MQLIAHGIDLVDCARIRDLLERHQDRFLERVFTPAERQYAARYHNQVERLAGRFAAKEAVFKLIGTGWGQGTAWTDIEVVNDPTGRPRLQLRGQTHQIAQQMGIQEISISLTHAANLAIASVVALSHRSKP